MTTDGDFIIVEAREDEAGLIGFVTFDNQRRLNAMNRAMIEELIDAMAALAADDALRLVVFTGAGERAFIGGADLTELIEMTPATAREFITRLHVACKAIRDLAVPTIARINGYVLGAGLEVAASCDLRVAHDGAVLGMPEVRVGLPSVIEAALFPGLIGWGKTRELLLTGSNITAVEARACGLVERIVGEADLDAAVESWIEAILRCGPLAIRSQKELIRKWERMSLEDGIVAGIDHLAGAFETDEPRRMIQSFFDARDAARG